jgi:hypothetical protein
MYSTLAHNAAQIDSLCMKMDLPVVYRAKSDAWGLQLMTVRFLHTLKMMHVNPLHDESFAAFRARDDADRDNDIAEYLENYSPYSISQIEEELRNVERLKLEVEYSTLLKADWVDKQLALAQDAVTMQHALLHFLKQTVV